MTFIRYLLTIPSAAQDISSEVMSSMPDMLSTQVYFSDDGLARVEQLIAQQLKSSVAYGPCSGADTASLSLLVDADVNVMTGSDPFGMLNQLRETSFEHVQLFGTAIEVDGTIRRSYDSFHSTESFELGSFAIRRAVMAEYVRGNNVASVHIAGIVSRTKNHHYASEQLEHPHYFEYHTFILDPDGNLTFKPFGDTTATFKNAHAAFWLTLQNGRRKIYIYRQISLLRDDIARSCIDPQSNTTQKRLAVRAIQSKQHQEVQEIHALLKKVSTKNTIVVLLKAMPQGFLGPAQPFGFERFFQSPFHRNARKLTSPAFDHMKAIICDTIGIGQKVPVAQIIGTHKLRHQAIDMQKLGSSFGYGNVIHIYQKRKVKDVLRLPDDVCTT